MNIPVSHFLRALAVVGVLLTAGCTDTPVTPTPPVVTYDPPVIACPASQSVTTTTATPISVVYSQASVVGGAPPLTTTCTPASGSTFPVGITTVTCTTRDAQQRTSSCSLTIGVTLPARLTATRFVAFGDSITAGENGQNSLTADIGGVLTFLQSVILFGSEYPTVLRGSLRTRYALQADTIDVVNAGVPGEAAGNPATLTRFSSAISGRQAVLIMEGSNDLYTAYSGGSGFTDAAIANIRTMVQRAKTANVKPFLATVPPMNPQACTPICRGFAAGLVGPFNDRIRLLASAEGATLVDVHKAFNGDFSLLDADGLHPNARGFELIAATFFDQIKATLE